MQRRGSRLCGTACDETFVAVLRARIKPEMSRMGRCLALSVSVLPIGDDDDEPVMIPCLSPSLPSLFPESFFFFLPFFFLPCSLSHFFLACHAFSLPVYSASTVCPSVVRAPFLLSSARLLYARPPASSRPVRPRQTRARKRTRTVVTWPIPVLASN